MDLNLSYYPVVRMDYTLISMQNVFQDDIPVPCARACRIQGYCALGGCELPAFASASLIFRSQTEAMAEFSAMYEYDFVP